MSRQTCDVPVQSLPYRLPQPIALPLRRMHACPDPARRRRHLECAADMAVRLLAFAALVDHRCGREGPDSLEAGLRDAARDGPWWQALASLAAALREAAPPEPFTAPLWQAEALQALADAREESRDMRRRTAALLEACGPLARFEMGYLAEHREDRLSGTHHYVFHRSLGSEECFSYTSWRSSVPLPVERAFLVDPHREEMLLLDPLVRCRVCPQDEVMRVFMLRRFTEGEAVWDNAACDHHLVATTETEEYRGCRALIAPGTGPRFAGKLLRLPTGAPDGSRIAREDASFAVSAEINGSWRIVAFVRTGGSAEAYQVAPLRGGELRLLKMLRADLARDEKQVLRFERTARLARGIHHPRLLEVLDQGFHQERPYLVTEYLSGGDLASRLEAEGPLPLTEARRVLREVAEGLAALHRLGIVHRDLTPSNVLFGSDGSARLGDFGLVLPGRGAGFTGSATLLGTFGYMAPEQREGSAVDSRSDLYSLGILATVMVSGRLPRSTEEAETALAVWPPRLRSRLRACLEGDPSKRPRSVTPLLRLLEESPGDPDPERRFGRWRAAFRDRLRDWQAHGQLPEWLLAPRDLQEARNWRSTHGDCLDRGELEFLLESERAVRAEPETRAKAWFLDTLLPLAFSFAVTPWSPTAAAVAWLGFLLYHALGDSAGRALPGRRLTGSRLVDRAGRAVSWTHALVRAAMANFVVPFMLVLVLSLRASRLLDLGWAPSLAAWATTFAVAMMAIPTAQMLANVYSFYSGESKLAFHDRLAGTQVILCGGSGAGQDNSCQGVAR